MGNSVDHGSRAKSPMLDVKVGESRGQEAWVGLVIVRDESADALLRCLS